MRHHRHFYAFGNIDIDYEYLRFSAKSAGIGKAWRVILRSLDDLNRYRGKGLDLPPFVRVSARFGGNQLQFSRGFLRIPIMPQSAKLYGSQLTTLLLNRELKNSVRLSLLPCLATAAAVGQKITGSDKGIW